MNTATETFFAPLIIATAPDTAAGVKEAPVSISTAQDRKHRILCAMTVLQ